MNRLIVSKGSSPDESFVLILRWKRRVILSVTIFGKLTKSKGEKKKLPEYVTYTAYEFNRIIRMAIKAGLEVSYF